MHILIAESARTNLDNIATYLSHPGNEHSLAHAADFDELLAKVGEAQPEIVVVDEFLDGFDLLRGVEAVHERSPDSKLAVVSNAVSLEKVRHGLKNGAYAYIDQSLKAEAWPSVLALVLAGEKYVPAAAVIGDHGDEPGFTEKAQNPYMATRAGFPELTRREAEILSMLVTGATNKEIADCLSRKEITVTSHLKQIFRKLGAHNRTQAAMLALRRLYGFPVSDSGPAYAWAQNVNDAPANASNPGDWNENTSS